MTSFRAEEELPLQGCIVQVPLIIENEASSKILSTNSIWVHVTKADYEPSADPNFINISLVSIWAEGYYHTTIKKQNIYNVFENSASRKIQIDRENTYDVFTDLFPLDLDTLVESRRKDGIHKSLLLNAKINVSESNFKREEGLNTDTMHIQIKSNGTFNPTVGRFEMTSVDFEKTEYLKDEGNLFNWMELLCYQRDELARRQIESCAEIERLQTDNSLLQQGMEQAKNDFEELKIDMASKFYQGMNAKKDFIHELTKASLPKTELLGLNAIFLAKIADRGDDINACPLKKKGTRGKRVKEEKGSSKKKRKVKKEDEDNEEGQIDYRDDTTHTDRDDSDGNPGQSVNNKFKKDPRIKRESRSSELKNGSEPKVKKEPEGEPKTYSSKADFRVEPKITQEQNTPTAPRSPELKGDLNPIIVKPDPYTDSTPLNHYPFSFGNEDSQGTLKADSLLKKSLNLETDRDIFNKAMHVSFQEGGNKDKDDGEEHEENGGQDSDEKMEYNSSESDNESTSCLNGDGKAKDKGDKEEDVKQGEENDEEGTSSKDKNYEGSFIEDSLESSISKSKPDINNETQNRTDYSDEEFKHKEVDNDNNKSQREVSQAEAETDYSDDDDDG
ncbi:hypothetical protein CANMA_000921 [Candida margitis]|uniref:uncharacterized protein n=1 Tax=Candida margitis TaxID=1775924 RepID=UPI002227DE1A|nr:uncharacterized protein CANMA_000921 [Candida margitis]KAI5970018.1 hypothetical protein CANMA_000921 [Candida margitis]